MQSNNIETVEQRQEAIEMKVNAQLWFFYLLIQVMSALTSTIGVV